MDLKGNKCHFYKLFIDLIKNLMDSFQRYFTSNYLFYFNTFISCFIQ